ncbi:MAG: helix-turn-helix domain-containing protein [Spirochaetaceae bacterium]|nr:helix-turn-helix domain-containing protein [Spirochaetaceae bacterium]
MSGTSRVLDVVNDSSVAFSIKEKFELDDIHSDPARPLDVFSRRNAKPIMREAFRVAEIYTRSTGLGCVVLGDDVRALNDPEGTGNFFCQICKKYLGSPDMKKNPNAFPCTQKHINAYNETKHTRDVCIYTCPMGFMYWISAFFIYSRHAGAFICGQALCVDHEQGIAYLQTISKGEISRSMAVTLLEKRLSIDYEKARSFANVLRACANHVPRGLHALYDPLARRKNRRGTGGRVKTTPYSLERERLFIAALRRGDADLGRKLLNEMLEAVFTGGVVDFTEVRFIAIERVVFLSRIARNKITRQDIEINDRYLRRILEAKDIDELKDILNIIVDSMAGDLFSFRGTRHASALRKAERYIWSHYTKKVKLADIAAASGLSAPYFSTIFKEEMGENLSVYLNRLRVEKAMHLLIESSLSLNEIAVSCGFEDQSWFSKTFKQFTGMSPGKYRETGAEIAIF